MDRRGFIEVRGIAARGSFLAFLAFAGEWALDSPWFSDGAFSFHAVLFGFGEDRFARGLVQH